MRIAVVGSFPSDVDKRWPLIGTVEEFRHACTELGRQLAKSGHELSVQYDREDAADPYVVFGYVERASQARLPSQRITVWCPRREGQLPFAALARQNPTLFSIESADTGKWDSARFKMCCQADATIMIGGHARSETTGFLVLAAGKLLIPIAGFGGAASALLPLVERRFLNAPSLPPPLTSSHLKEFWSDPLLERIASSLGDYKPRIVIIHGRDSQALDSVVAYISSELKWGRPQDYALGLPTGRDIT